MKTARSFASLVKLQHTVFSAPFVALGVALAADGVPSVRLMVFVTLALIAARTAAMAFNRIVDVAYDSENPRTSGRELVTGELSLRQAKILTTVSAILFVVFANALNQLCGILALPALALILGYSFAKRFTALSHFVLGLALGISPGAGWLAVGAPLSATPFLLGAIVVFWVAGFDILYSLADADFDNEHKLHSIPSAMGKSRAIVLARLFHVICFGLMIALFFQLQLPALSLLSIVPTFALFVRQHTLVSAEDLSRLDVAFFTVNGWIGFLYCIAVGVVYFAL
jgi:4-hydroxybenzoate polyprenyltransferase